MTKAAKILKTVRERAGLSQRDLANLAGTTQSVVARIESESTSPGLQTLDNLIRCAGFEMTISIEQIASTSELTHMLGDVTRILALTPEQRLRELKNASQFLAASSRL